MATYYISASRGNDNNNGLSETTPFKTAKKVAQKDFLKPGDKVLFRRGDKWTYNNAKVVIESHGTADNPIIISAYGNGNTPVLDGYKTTGVQWRGLVSIGLNGYASYVIVDGLYVKNSATSGFCTTGKNTVFRNCTAKGCNSAGFYFSRNFSGHGNGADDGTALNCVAEDNCYTESQAFTTECRNTKFINCVAQYNQMAGFDFLDYSEKTDVTGGIAMNCVAYMNSLRHGSWDPGFYVDGGRDITIDHCISYGHGASVTANYCAGIGIGNEHPHLKTCDNIVIKDCLSYGNKGSALVLNKEVKSAFIQNNVFAKGEFGFRAIEWYYNGDTAKFVFSHNLFYSKDNIVFWETEQDIVSAMLHNNKYYGNTDLIKVGGKTMSLADWQVKYGKDNGSSLFYHVPEHELYNVWLEKIL